MDLSTRIAAWRKAKGVSQRELAVAVGVSVAAVYQWEGTGESRTSPSQAHLAKLVEALGLTMERFYGRLPKVSNVA